MKNIAIGIDQLGNAILRGDPDETVSSRAAKARNRGELWGCYLCAFLDWLDPDHCTSSIEKDRGNVVPDEVVN